MPTPSVPAGEIERFVVEQIKCIGRDPAVVAETVRQVREQTEATIERLDHERDAVKETDIRPIAATLDWRKQRCMWATLQQRLRGNEASSR